MIYLHDVETIIKFNLFVINETGGTAGIRDVGRLQAVISTQTQQVFGQVVYLSIFEKSAAIIRGIIEDHPFVDGNKRTAMIAGLVFLELNGYKFEAEIGEIENFAVKVAIEKTEIEEIVRWLESRCIATKLNPVIPDVGDF